MFSTEIYYIVKILALKFSKWTVLLEKYCVTKFIHTWKRQCNASKSKYFSWPDLRFGVLVSFSRQTDFQDFNIPSWLKTDKILAVMPFFSETWRLFHTWLCQAPLRQKLPSCVRRGQIFLLPCPTLCDSSLRAWWWPDKEMPSCGNQDHLLTHPSPCVLRALTGLKATWGSPHAAEGAQHQHLSSIPSFSHKTTFASLLPSMLAEERSFVLPKAAVLCRVPTATSSWLISSNSCSPLHASKEQSYF